MKEVFTRVQEFMTSNAVTIASDATLPAAKLTKHSDFRHLPVVQNAGTMMLRRRYSIELVSKTHGHADISTTYYCHVLMTERREHVVGLLGNFLLACPDKNDRQN